MATASSVQRLHIAELEVELVRKDIRHLHLRVYAPLGRVRVSAPLRASQASIEALLVQRLPWIRTQQARLCQLAATPEPLGLLSGEIHYLMGQAKRLELVEHSGPAGVIDSGDRLLLRLPATADEARRRALLQAFYRTTLKAQIPALLARWQPIIGVQAASWGVRRMKTRWGSCNIGARRIWLALELAKKPAVCLEYVLVHELVHLLERYHNARFYGLMDQFLPDWRERRTLLNSAPAPGELALS